MHLKSIIAVTACDLCIPISTWFLFQLFLSVSHYLDKIHPMLIKTNSPFKGHYTGTEPLLSRIKRSQDGYSLEQRRNKQVEKESNKARKADVRN